MGVGKIFSRREQWGIFPNFFQGGPKVVKFDFYPSKLKKQPFLANNFKIQEGQRPSLPPVSDAHGPIVGHELLLPSLRRTVLLITRSGMRFTHCSSLILLGIAKTVANACVQHASKLFKYICRYRRSV